MNDSPRSIILWTVYTVCAFFVAFVVWASITVVDEIARGEGRVIPFSKTQIIQASEPGVVKEIAVQVGQQVAEGDLLLRLDDTTSGSTLGESEARARALTAGIARLRQEQAGDLARYNCPPLIVEKAPEICKNEEMLLKARALAFDNRVSVLQQRVRQREREIGEARANKARLEENAVLVRKELDLLRPLVQRQIAPQTDLIRLERELTELNGQLNLTEESLGRLEAALEEAELQVEEATLMFRQEANATLTETLAELSVVEETVRGASERVARTDIRSPVDGVVNTLDVNTIGAYVQQGAVIGGVVPTSDTLLVEARISPSDVAFIRPGLPALIKVSAYDFSIFGGLQGRVANVSADSLVDQETGEAYYQVRVETDSSRIEHNGRSYSIIPGMICTVEIKTGAKTILQYLLKPINKTREEALSER